MKDEHRKFKNCIFCSTELTAGKNGTRSREHIFGKSIAEELGIKDNWSAPANSSLKAQNPFKYQSREKGSSPLTSLTSRSVCRRCNGGILREQLEAAKPLLTGLFRGTKNKFSQTQQISIFKYFCRLGIIVDAETSNLDLDKKGPDLDEYAKKHGSLRYFIPTITPEQRAKLIDDEIPNFVKVYIGLHDGVLGDMMEFSVPSARSSFGSREKRVSFAVKKLAILIVLGRHTIEIPSSYISVPNLTELTWPQKPHVTYDDFYATYYQNVETRWLRHYLRERRHRRLVEKSYKKSGRVLIPHPPPNFT